MPIYALAYERVSTEEQADSNNSIPAQRRRIEEYASKTAEGPRMVMRHIMLYEVRTPGAKILCGRYGV